MEGAGNGELLFSGYGVSVWGDETVLQIFSDYGCIKMSMYLMSQNHTLKNS